MIVRPSGAYLASVTEPCRKVTGSNFADVVRAVDRPARNSETLPATASAAMAATRGQRLRLTVGAAATTWLEGLDRVSRLNATSRADWKRSSGLFSMQWSTIRSSAGGSAWLDGAGVLKVGPRSAGADPGPACYGLHGEEPTLTAAVIGPKSIRVSQSDQPDAGWQIESRRTRALRK